MNPRIERAILLIQQGRYDLAEKEAGLELAQSPGNDLAHRLIALCLVHRKQFKQATDHAQQAVGLAPDDPHNHAVLSQVWRERNYIDRSMAAAAEAIRLSPEDADLHTLASELLLRQKQWQKALECADRALKLDPEHAGALNVRAFALRNLGKRSESSQQLTEALQQNPEDPTTHANLGWTHLEKGDRSAAKKHFREALRLDPDSEWARVGMIEAIKAGNPVYRVVLNYFLWMQKWSAGVQLGILIAAYLLYRTVVSQVQAHPEWGPFLWPLVGCYIAFAITTWIAVPLANLFLCLHPFGRLALKRQERLDAIIVGLALAVTLALAIVAFALSSPLATEAALAALLVSGCICMTTMSVPQGRPWLIAYTAIAAVMALLVVTAPVVLKYFEGQENAGLLAFCWLIAAGLSQRLFYWSLLGAVLLVNVLNSKNWKE